MAVRTHLQTGVLLSLVIGGAITGCGNDEVSTPAQPPVTTAASAPTTSMAPPTTTYAPIPTTTAAPTSTVRQVPVPDPDPDPDPDPVRKAPAPPPAPKPEPKKEEPKTVYYKNCSAARAAGAAPVHRGDAGYGSHLDRDGDGVGCE